MPSLRPTSQRLVAAIVGLASLSAAFAHAEADRNISFVDSTGQGNGIEAECSIAVDPTNPRNILVAGHDPYLFHHIAAFSSADSGENWQSRYWDDDVDSIDAVTRSDPSAAFAPNGDAFLAYVAATTCPAGGSCPHTVLCARRSTGDSTWTVAMVEDRTPHGSGKYVDKPYVSCGRKPSGNGYNVYVVYSRAPGPGQEPAGLCVAVSEDSGATFPRRTLVEGGALGTVKFGHVAVDANGICYVVYQAAHVSVEARLNIRVARSTNAGVSFTAPATIGATPLGEIYAVPFKIPAQPGRGICAVPSIAVNGTANSNHPGRLYVSYTIASSMNPETDTDIVIQHSDDQAASWSAPTVLHKGSTKSQFLPWVSVDTTTGYVGVAFYDARDDVDNEKVHAFVAVSADGGNSWFDKRVGDEESDQSWCTTPGCLNYAEYLGLSLGHGGGQVAFSRRRSEQYPQEIDYFWDRFSYSDILSPSLLTVSPGNYATIQAAMDAAEAGDTVVVVSQLQNSPATLAANVGVRVDGSTATLNAGGSQAALTVGKRYHLSGGIDLTGLTITNFSNTGLMIDGRGEYGYTDVVVGGGTVDGNANGKYGLQMLGVGAGSDAAGARFEVQGMHVEDIPGDGVMCDSADVVCAGVTCDDVVCGFRVRRGLLTASQCQTGAGTDTAVVAHASSCDLSECDFVSDSQGCYFRDSGVAMDSSWVRGQDDGGISVVHGEDSYTVDIEGNIVESGAGFHEGAAGIYVDCPPVASGVSILNNTVRGWSTGIRLGTWAASCLETEPPRLEQPWCERITWVWVCCYTTNNKWYCFERDDQTQCPDLSPAQTETYEVRKNLVTGYSEEGIDCDGIAGTLSCNNVWSSTGTAFVGCTDALASNTSAAPLYCGAGPDSLTLRLDSPGTPGNSICGELIGARPLGCVPDTLAGNTTVAEGTAVDIGRDLVVPAGTTLLLKPGVEFRFDDFDDARHGLDQDKNELVVHGNLVVDGSPTGWVTFTSARETPAEGDWWGILLWGSGSSVDLADVQYSDWGLVVGGETATIEHCDFSDNALTDLKTGNESNGVILRHNTLSVGAGTGMELAAVDSVLENVLTATDSTTAAITFAAVDTNTVYFGENSIGGEEFAGIAFELGQGLTLLERNEVTSGSQGVQVSSGVHRLGTEADTTSDNTFNGVTTGVYVCRMGPGQCPASAVDVELRNNNFENFTDGVVVQRVPHAPEAPVNLGLGTTGGSRGRNAFVISTLPPPGTVRAIAREGGCPDTLMARGNYFGPLVPAGLIQGAVDTTGCMRYQPGSTVMPVEPTPSAKELVQVWGAFPNPTAAGTRLLLSVSSGEARVGLEVFDVLGRLIRRTSPQDAASATGIDWDGRDQAGRAVPSGLYFVRVLYELKTIGTVRVIVAR